MTLSEYRSLRKRMRVAAFTLFAFVAGFAAGAAPGFTGCTQQDLTPVPDTSALCPAAAAFADNAGSAQPEKWVCLTFDDGPSRTTPAVLAALDAAGVHGTFFVVATTRSICPCSHRLPLPGIRSRYIPPPTSTVTFTRVPTPTGRTLPC